MLITIDAVPLLLPSSGVKNHLYHWTRHLMRAGTGVDIRLFPLLGEPSVLNHQGSVAGAATTFARLSLVRALNRLGGIGSRLFLSGTDVFHAATLVYPPRGPKLTATIYDLTCWILPETHQRSNVKADYRIAERIWNRADGLIAISESTRNDAVRLLKMPERKMRVIYPGVAEPYFLAGSGEADRVRTKLGLVRPYLLFVGTIEPRKNVDLLLDAFGALPPSIADEFELVVAGPRGWAGSATLARLDDPPRNVRYLGYVAEDDLPGLFAGATAFAFPSLYEGFGLPVAQALAAGVPVIASGGSSLGEITAGAARLVDARSTSELRDAIADVLTSPGTRSRLSELGRVQGARFTWEASARQSIEFFRAVEGGSL
jgi:glycosyltransferase involved in cell wall biosynthesis